MGHLKLIKLGDDINGLDAWGQSGRTLSLSGDGMTVAIGSFENIEKDGSVSIYRLNSSDSTWNQIGDELIINPIARAQFGDSVSLSYDGNILAVGATQYPGGDPRQGLVRTYEYSDNKWSQIGPDLEGLRTYDEFGVSVSLSDDGKKLAVGAHGYPGGRDAFQAKGIVAIYEYNEDSWDQLGDSIIGSDDYNAGNWSILQSGFSVSLNGMGTRVAIGAPGAGTLKNGQVKIYEYNEGSWVQFGATIVTDNSNQKFDGAGYSVSLNGNGMIVAFGAIGYDGPDGSKTNSGRVRVYEYNGTKWVQIGADILGNEEYDHLGISISLSDNGKKLAVGAHLYDSINKANTGQVKVFMFEENDWLQIDELEGNEEGENFGYSVSLSANGKVLAIGAPGPISTNNVDDAGHVELYVSNPADNVVDPVPVELYATACFTKDAVVKTDQGLVNINKITTKHTIDDQFIKGISKTMHIQNKLVSIDPGAFGKNQPNKKTLVAPFHRFLVDNKLKMALELVDNDTVYLVKYRQQPLYNIILEKLGTMEVNNVIVETLDPNSLVANLFDGSLSTKQRSKIVKSFNAYHENLKNKPNKTVRDYRF
ncbi:Hint domain-containing protein [bacterium]|nr:Hint domain-containing protein [bacterium]